jgi:hypothetical protein
MAETLAGPVAQIGNRLSCGGAVQRSSQMLGPYHSEHFDVDDMGRRLVGISRQTGGNLSGPRCVRDYLEQTRSVNDQHQATRRAIRRG